VFVASLNMPRVGHPARGLFFGETALAGFLFEFGCCGLAVLFSFELRTSDLAILALHFSA
jgi:hypothetical protein